MSGRKGGSRSEKRITLPDSSPYHKIVRRQYCCCCCCCFSSFHSRSKAGTASAFDAVFNGQQFFQLFLRRQETNSESREHDSLSYVNDIFCSMTKRFILVPFVECTCDEAGHEMLIHQWFSSIALRKNLFVCFFKFSIVQMEKG